MANRKSQFSDQFLIRLPDGLRDRIAEVARKEMRTMNGQINFWLQAALDQSSAGKVDVDRNA